MEFVKAFGIHTLVDLAKPEIWQNLSNLLLSFWAECLYINDKDFNYKAMPDPVQKKFLRYITPQYWNDLKEKKERLRAKQGYKEICNLYQYKEEKEIVTSLITEKLKPKNLHLLTI
jgi:hypothetical protein